MEDIYSNLDNYEEERNFEQLQKENDVLREKIDVINYSLARLQADYDTLKKEHKKMQSNYSSLLKTAKAEIERKTHLIRTLNNEKDQLILKHLSEPTNRYSNNRKVTYVKDKNFKQNDNKNMNELLDHKKGNVTDMSCEEEDLRTTLDKRLKEKTRNSSSSHRSQSEENYCRKIESNDTLQKNKHWKIDEEKLGKGNVETSKKVEECRDNVHNYVSTKTDDSINKTNIVSSRRKSVSKHLLTSQFNSEDESCDDPKWSYVSSHFDDHHQFERNSSRKGKYTDSSYVPNRDKYDSKNQRWRDFETNKRMFRSRAPDREWKESRFQRTEHDQRRHLESPHDTIRQKRREHRSEYYSDRYKNSYREQKSFKHRLNDDSEESVKSKKPRTEETNTQSINTNKEEEPTEVNMDITEIDEIDACALEEIFIDNYIKKPKDVDTTTLTAVQHEDPRLTSKKYMKVLDSKNNVSICTVTETNIDLKYIQYDNDISPSKNSVTELGSDLIKEIYNDIDNEIREMSVESGDIAEFNEEANHNDTEDNFKEVQVQNNISLTSLSDKEIKPYSGFNTKQEISTNSVTNGIAKYRIPKIKDRKDIGITEYNNDNNRTNVTLIENNSSILRNCLERAHNTTEERVLTDKFTNMCQKNNTMLKDPTVLAQPNHIDNNPDFSSYKNTKVVSLNLDITDKNKVESTLRDSVVDDLALSDDNSDYNEQNDNLCLIESNNFVNLSAKSHNSNLSQISNTESYESDKNILTPVSGNNKYIATLPALSTDTSLITPEDLDLPLKQIEPMPAIFLGKNIPYEQLDTIEESEHLKKTQKGNDKKSKAKEFFIRDKLDNKHSKKFRSNDDIKENTEDKVNYEKINKVVSAGGQGSTVASTTRLSKSCNINYPSDLQALGESTSALVTDSYTNKDISPANCSNIPKPNENKGSLNVVSTSGNPPPDIRIVVKRRRTVCRKPTSTNQ